MQNKEPHRGKGDFRNHNVNLGVILGYSVGSLGTGIYSSVPSVLLLFFMTDTLAIAPSLAALAFFFPKIWDVITDPIMGIVSDHTRSKMGRRRPYLLLGAILMSLTFIGLFNVPEFQSSTRSFVYILVVFTMSATAYTIFAVPYIAMPAEMSNDHHERTVIMSYRMGFAMAGILIGSAFAPYLVEWTGGGRQGYANMSLVIGAICAMSMLLSFFATRAAPQTRIADTRNAPKLGSHFKALFQNRPFVFLMAIYLLQLAAMGIFMAVIPYYATYILGADVSFVGTIFFVMIGTAVVTMVIWTFTAKALGKKTAFILSAIMFSLGTLSLFQVDASNQPLYLFARISLVGFGLAGMQMLPFSMLTDAIRVDRLNSGQAREGIFTGFWTASEKLGLALGPLFVGTSLAVLGFEESGAETIHTQSDASLMGIRVLTAVVPFLFVVFSAILTRLYPITEKTLARLESQHSE